MGVMKVNERWGRKINSRSLRSIGVARASIRGANEENWQTVQEAKRKLWREYFPGSQGESPG